MKPSLIRIRRQRHSDREDERGATIALVAVAMVAIIAMAALSIDAITLYLANAEAQRSADSAALAAARVISLSGITGTGAPSNQSTYWQNICGASGAATQTAQAVASQNTVGGVGATVTVGYSTGPGVSGVADCSTLTSAFAVNPLVVVKVQRTDLPTFFARIWGKTGSSVSATAAAEGFNPSNSGSYVATGLVPVQPRCVKPWLVPNFDPLNPGGCTQTNCKPLVSTIDGSITNPGISLNGTNTGGVIGETFSLVPDCHHNGGSCTLRVGPQQPSPQPMPNAPEGVYPQPNLQYVPGEVANASTAVPSCSDNPSHLYEQAIEGCDQTTVYQCGVQGQNVVDLTENPARNHGDSTSGVQCLTTQGNGSGQDTMDTTGYPFQIKAGASNPMVTAGVAGVVNGSVITSSNSVVTVPIYDSANTVSSPTSNVTIVGFMQVFINSVDNNGDVNVTVLNVSGCSNNATGSPIRGSSPVPVRLVTPP